MPYVDYNFYFNNWLGNTIPDDEFEKYIKRAQHEVEYYTFGRIDDNVTDKVKNAICAVADILYDVYSASDNIPRGIKSESVDDVSITYDTTAPNQNQITKQIYAAIKRELFGTGLLYRGF